MNTEMSVLARGQTNFAKAILNPSALLWGMTTPNYHNGSRVPPKQDINPFKRFCKARLLHNTNRLTDAQIIDRNSPWFMCLPWPKHGETGQTISAYRKLVSLVWGMAAVLHSSDEPGIPSQCLSFDYSTTDTVLCTITITKTHKSHTPCFGQQLANSGRSHFSEEWATVNAAEMGEKTTEV